MMLESKVMGEDKSKLSKISWIQDNTFQQIQPLKFDQNCTILIVKCLHLTIGTKRSQKELQLFSFILYIFLK